MRVTKRNGTLQPISFDKILYRLKKLQNEKGAKALDNISVDVVTQQVIQSIYDEISTAEIDELSARISISMSIDHPEYAELASRIVVSNLHKKTTECFSDSMEKLYANETQGEHSPLIAKEIIEIIRNNKDKLNFSIDYSRDYLFDYFGFKTVERSYLLKIKENNDVNGKWNIIERPQHMWMRVSLGIHKNDIEKAIETYTLLSQFYFTHATPTLFNSGTSRPALSSCYLLGILDSMSGIYKCLSDCAMISKNSGGIGIHISNIRGEGSYIRGTNGRADGIVKMLRVFNETARYANQGSKRNGSFAIYLEPHHTDVFEFLELKKNTGDENTKCRDLFYALWVPDLLMKCVDKDEDWYLMDPNTSKGLNDVYGDEYETLYNQYVKESKFTKKVKARDLWNKILVSQIETGMPYMLYKDHVNKKSNQKNIGTIKSSNLCAEILLYSDDKEYGVCNIATLGLPKYVEKTIYGYTFNYNKLFEVTKIVTRNMNNVIDYNYYPVPETRVSNMRHRPIAIGAQGLANVFLMMGIPFESKEACEINKKIFETIYYGAVFESNQLAKTHGAYETFEGSPASKGLFQFDMWGKYELSGLWDWDLLREDVKKYGLRNSMLTALPPTASTSQILGNFESFEPITSNIFMRSTLSGDFPVVNKYLIEELQKIDLWNENIRERIMYHKGSVQNIPEIPVKIKQIFKTVWECSQKKIMEMSRDRGVFVDHTQSLNLYMKDITPQKLSSAHFHGWKLGLKTSMYYCRSTAAEQAQQFTVSVETQKAEKEMAAAIESCSRENPESCLMCSG